MKIAFFHELPKGGARSAVDKIANLLKKEGVQVDLYSTLPKSELGKENYRKVYSYKFKAVVWNGKNWKARFYKDTIELLKLNFLHKKIASQVDEKGYDLVFVNASKFLETPFIIRHLKAKNVYYCHDPHDRSLYDPINEIGNSLPLHKKLYEKLIRFIKKKLDYHNFRKADFILSNSEYVKNTVKKTYSRDSDVIYLGVDQKVFKPITAKKEYELLFIGSKRKIDGYDLLNEITGSLSKKIKVKKMLIEDEWFDDPREVNKVYNSSKIFLALAVREPFGLSPLEAMSSGTPVIAVNDGGYKETIVDGVNGYLVGRNSKKVLDKIKKLLGDDKLRIRFSKNARVSVLNKWNWDNSAKNILKKFEEIIKIEKHKEGGTILKLQSFLIILILILSAFINLYKLDPLTLFIADFGKDYLTARDMILSGHIPLVGIKSSVIWLHQGPLSVYLIGLALFISNFNPIVPAIMYSVLGVLTIYFVFKLGHMYFDKWTGILGALFYATSPLIVINSRMPYHTSPIPLVTGLFFFCLHKVINGKKQYLFLTAFILGLLLQLELSNAVILLVLAILFIIRKPKVLRRDVFISSIGFIVGVLPFILYDITNKFVYTIGFPLWIINRIRLVILNLFFEKDIGQSQGAFPLIYQQVSSLIFPASVLIVILILILVTFTAVIQFNFLRKKSVKYLEFVVILLWLAVPLIAFTVHSTPGPAYFPLIYIPLSLFIAYSVNLLSRYNKVLILIFVLGCFFNVSLLLRNEYFLFTAKKANLLPPFNYGYGFSIDVLRDLTKFIVKDAGGKEFDIRGDNNRFQSENLEYLIWYQKGKLSKNSNLIYKIYTDEQIIPDEESIIFKNKYFYVTKSNKNG